jgi:outer membrane protein assembly factor BamB
MSRRMVRSRGQGLLAVCVLAGWSVAAAASAQALAGPWPQFRGPGGSGVAEEQRPPVEFGPAKNVKWKVPAPKGWSSPIVAGDKLVITAFDGGKLFTIAYDRASGKEVWRSEAPAEQIERYHKTESSPASSTPATDGTRIVSYFGSCGLFCHDLSGKELWKYPLSTAVMKQNFGSGVSPIIVDGLVILVRDVSGDSKIIALDVASGELKWQRKRLSPVSYGTPIVWETAAGKQIVVSGHARLIAYDLKKGEEKWSVRGIPASCCTSPVAAEGILFFAGGSGGDDEKPPAFKDLLAKFDKNKDGVLSRAEAGEFKDFFDHLDEDMNGKLTGKEWDALMKFGAEGKDSAFVVEAGGSGDVTESHVPWKTNKGLPFVASAIVYRGHCVMVKNGGIVTAHDARTGKEAYKQRVAEGTYYASPVAANGHIYFTSLDDGTVTVLKVGAGKAEVVATNPKLDERVAATPAIAEDTLYLRTAGHLYAFAEKK